MKEEIGTIEQIALGVLEFFNPLEELVDDDLTPDKDKPRAFRKLLAELGLLLPPEIEQSPAFLSKFKKVFESIVKFVKQLPKEIKAIKEGPINQIPAKGKKVFDIAKTIFDNSKALKEGIEQLGNALTKIEGAALENFGKNLPERFFEYLTISYIEKKANPIYTPLVTIDFITEQTKEAATSTTAAGGKFKYKERALQWDNLFGFLSNPKDKIEELFG